MKLSHLPFLEGTTLHAAQEHSRKPLHCLARNRYQLLGAVLLAVISPTLIHRTFDVTFRSMGSAEYTAFAALIGVCIIAYVLRQLTSFPGVSRLSYVPLVIIGTYGLIMFLFIYLRLDYSRLQLMASFLATLGWFAFCVSVEQKLRRPNLLVLPLGDAARLAALPQADWQIATAPDRIPPDVTGVVADLRADHGEAWERFLTDCALKGLPVYHCKQVGESLTGRVEIEHLSENTLGTILPSSIYMRFKRLCDIAGVVAAAPLAIVVGAVAALAIKFDDGGPVLYRQQRMGFRGVPFTVLKFRTMESAARKAAHYTAHDDPRITRVGRILRRYRIDELPQIINILKGEMSWIGPRPEPLPVAEWYAKNIRFYSFRHIVRPGISGWAQVNQGYVPNELEAGTQKLHYDFFYVKHFSPWLDLLILLRTVRVVLCGTGAR